MITQHLMTVSLAQERRVKHPTDWPWSSSSFYEHMDAGLLKIDPMN